MREAKNQDDIVSARLRSVLTTTTLGVRDQRRSTPTAATPPDRVPERGGSDFTDTSPLRWSDILPSWPDDVDPDPADGSSPAMPDPPPAPAGPSRSSEADEWGPPQEPESESLLLEALGAGEQFPEAGRSLPPGSAVHDDDATTGLVPALSGEGAFDKGWRRQSANSQSGGRLIALDPGRRGVKALGAVAVLVVLIAALLAWRARPRVDPVAVPPVDIPAAAPGTSGGAAGAGTAAVRPGSSGPGSAGGTEVVVAVGGHVRKPGLVRLPPGSRVADALRAAGGADPGIDVAWLNLARKVVDGELILVGVTPPPGAGVPLGGAGGPTGGAGRPAGGPINLNTATLADLDTLPGVGPVLAQRILDARDAQGGFKVVSDLRKVDGIGDARYEQLKDLVVV